MHQVTALMILVYSMLERRHARVQQRSIEHADGNGTPSPGGKGGGYLFFDKYTIIAASRLIARNLEADVRALSYTFNATCPPSRAQCAA